MKRLLTILLLVSTTLSFSQRQNGEEVANQIEVMQANYTYGNACDSTDDFEITIQGNLDMNGFTLEILNAHIIVIGEILNEGEIILGCDSAWLEIRGEVLSVPMVPIANRDFKLWPTPSEGYVYIEGDGIQSIEVYTLSGKLVKDFRTTTRKNKVMLDNLSTGIYMAIIRTVEGYTVTKKILKK